MSNEKYDLQFWDCFNLLDILIKEKSQYQTQYHIHEIDIENNIIEIDKLNWWNCQEREKSNELLKNSEKYYLITLLFHFLIHIISFHDISTFWVELIISQ